MRGVWLLCVLTVVAAAQAVAQNAKLSPYVGVYRDAPGEYIVIAPVAIADPSRLLLAETRTEQLRLLVAAGTDMFTTGPALTQFSPIERTLHLSSGPNRTLTIRLARSPSSAVVYSQIPLRLEEVKFRNGDVTLHGTLLIPAVTNRRGSAIVLAHGSENNDRNSFGPLPWVLAGHGYVVLAYDKRGTGSSSGKWQPAGIEPVAQDLAAAVDYVASRGDFAISRIAVIGTSEGGWVAANASRRRASVRLPRSAVAHARKAMPTSTSTGGWRWRRVCGASSSTVRSLRRH